MNELLNLYLDSDSLEEEFEIRFGTKGRKKITKIDFDNVVQYLLSKKFKHTYEDDVLKISTDYIDKRTGESRVSSIRTEIYGTTAIQKYCRTDNIKDENGDVLKNVTFIRKTNIYNEKNERIPFVEQNDFNFRAAYQKEERLRSTNGLVSQLINTWSERLKTFRLITRHSYVNDKYPYLRVDVSIVRSSSKRNTNNKIVPTYLIKDSQLFQSRTMYEIEIETRKHKIHSETNETVHNNLRKVIKYILCGLQQTNYPISYREMENISSDYLTIVYGGNKPKFISSKNFIGPSSISLEVKNVQKQDEGISIPNIRNKYTVTDKADGTRKLLFINSKGRIYMIDTNMNIQFTGNITKSKEHFNSIIDGEHVIHDKNGDFMNLYACFDIYFINKEDQREKSFLPYGETDLDNSNYRYYQLAKFVSSLQDISITNNDEMLNIQVKRFEVATPNKSIFKCCTILLDRIKKGLYAYETDGLIFTPCELGVGMTENKKQPSNYKYTWEHSFKWKPPEFNTIDFLVTTKKNEQGKEVIGNLFQSGENMTQQNQIKQYKTLILRVGFDESNPKHGYLNPCNDVIENKISYGKDNEDTEGYRPVPFKPLHPTDDTAYLCNIMLTESGQYKFMYTENGVETFEDNMIVEFKYNKDNNKSWRWVPIRVRYDKTAEFRNGLRNYGNAFHVAQSVWSSIHNPVTEEMICYDRNIPNELADDDVYYNRIGASETKSLRDFHNLFVKRKLIMGVSNPGNKLLDLAVGKGGDFPKWIASKLRFVFGIDVSKDNIENRFDGACARYLNYRKQNKRMLTGLFIHGNSGLRLSTGEACYTEKGKEIMNAILGKGVKDEKKLGKGVYNHYGIVENGFDIISIQFAFHYFLSDKETFHNVLQNISENCALQGYFIGTCYDGEKIFNLLKDKDSGESINQYKNNKKIWEITKAYDHKEFEPNETCVGYAIDVYQETINKVFREYLVHFRYLSHVMENYGFTLVTREEAIQMNLPNGSGLFSDLYNQLIDQYKKEKNIQYKGKTKIELEVGKTLELEKSPEEKFISFLNRYFIFKKTKHVNTEEVKKMYLSTTTTTFEDKLEKKEKSLLVDIEKDIPKPMKIKKTKRRIKLKQ